MNQLLGVVLFSIFFLSLQGPSNCNGGSSGNGGVLDVQDDCVDADLCKFECAEKSLKKRLILMKLDLTSSKISTQVKDAYYQTCSWNLERKEILTDEKMEVAQGRGQIISQFIATFARVYRKKLPKAKKPVGDSPHTLASNNGSPGDQLETGIGGIGHFNGVSTGISNPNDKLWIPTVETMRDWVDYLIYVSNQYTFFKDLCKKHGNVHTAQMKLKENLQNDATKGLYPKYHSADVPTIRKFVNKALDAIIIKFGELYNNPQNTCPCMSIINKIQDKKEKTYFKNVLKFSCKSKDIFSQEPNPLFKETEVENYEELDNLILESE